MTETNHNVLLIQSLLENWAKAVREKNIEQVLAAHSQDILLFDVVKPLQSKGIDNYRQSWVTQFFQWYGDHGRFDLTEVDITAGEDVAFCHSIIDCSGTENGKNVSYRIRLTVCLRKVAAQWMIVHEHHSESI